MFPSASDVVLLGKMTGSADTDGLGPDKHVSISEGHGIVDQRVSVEHLHDRPDGTE